MVSISKISFSVGNEFRRQLRHLLLNMVQTICFAFFKILVAKQTQCQQWINSELLLNQDRKRSTLSDKEYWIIKSMDMHMNRKARYWRERATLGTAFAFMVSWEKDLLPNAFSNVCRTRNWSCNPFWSCWIYWRKQLSERKQHDVHKKIIDSNIQRQILPLVYIVQYCVFLEFGHWSCSWVIVLSCSVFDTLVLVSKLVFVSIYRHKGY